MTKIYIEGDSKQEVTLLKVDDDITLIDSQKFPVGATLDQELVNRGVMPVEARTIAQRAKNKYRMNGRFVLEEKVQTSI
jgi:hypothetical protein